MTAATSGTWRWRAVDAAGRREKGVADAESPLALRRTLEERGLVVLDVLPAARAAAAARGARGGSRQDVLELTRALGALLAAGVPLSRALGTAAAIVPGGMTDVVDDLRRRIARGDAMTAALEAHPRLFPPLYRGVVRAGERSGNLAGAFAALATQLERDARLRERLLSASIYPLLLAVAGLGAVAVLVLWVLPRFASLLAGTGAALPRSTAAMLALADFVREAWPVLLGAIAAIEFVVAAGGRTEAGRRARSSALLQAPGVATLRRLVLAARFARLLGVLLAGGAPLLAALDDAAQSLTDPLAHDEVARIRARVHDGIALNVAIAEGTLFPPLLARLVAVGEEAGQLEAFLGRAAEICEERAARLLERLVTIVEPLMIVLLGAVVALVALSLLQAIYGLDASAFR
jgi:general secretion pathway protein F